MATFSIIRGAGPTKGLDTVQVCNSATLVASQCSGITGGDEVTLFTVPAGANVNKWTLNVITANGSAISGAIKDEDDNVLVADTTSLAATGATFGETAVVFAAEKDVKLVLGAGTVSSTLKLAVSAEYSIIPVV